jgi:hypothetical protein
LLATGQLGGPSVKRPVIDTHLMQRVARPIAGAMSSNSEEPQRPSNVFTNGEVREQIEALKHEPDTLQS